MNRYYNPVRTIQGPGCIAELENVLTEMDLPHKRVLVLAWDMSVFDLPAVAALADPEKGWDVQPRCFCESNPTVEQLFEIYQETRGFAPDVVVAVGGGSIMDVGKSLCCLYGREIHQVSELRTVIQLKLYDEPQARWIGVPTTAGTGSETTCWATIWDPEQDVKRSVECQQNYAYAALVDPELGTGMPPGRAAPNPPPGLAPFRGPSLRRGPPAPDPDGRSAILRYPNPFLCVILEEERSQLRKEDFPCRCISAPTSRGPAASPTGLRPSAPPPRTTAPSKRR